jgi:anthranilate synthase component 1
MYNIKTHSRTILADTITPVSLYLKIRDVYPQSIMLESSDYHGGRDNYSFICMEPLATVEVRNHGVSYQFPDESLRFEKHPDVVGALKDFFAAFKSAAKTSRDELNGFFGYISYDSVKYFEDIDLRNREINDLTDIPDIRYSLYRYIIAINHFRNSIEILENRLDEGEDNIAHILELINSRNYAVFPFETDGKRESNLTDSQYKDLVSEGKKECHRGNVYQIVLSRRFSQSFKGDEFNVYRSLRSINPSPYLFYFDFGSFRIFGSSPESQLIVKKGKARICPIAGTFRRTGDDQKDQELAEKLGKDEKENAEHVMLVDLARNDLSRNAENVKVDTYKEIQFYSHVLHMVSTVTGDLPHGHDLIRLVADTFPAGTLSGAPKIKAMQLIDELEPDSRSYYGGCIGQIGLDGSFNHAISIRTFLSKNNTLIYQAGAGIVADSNEESELQEVNNKLAALNRAIQEAGEIRQ